MRSGASPAIDWPSKVTSPESGGIRPVIKLNSVVLPAPFGPITLRISPGSSARSTPSTAWTPPKCRFSPRISSSGATSGPPDQAARPEANHQQQQDAVQDVAVVGQGAEQLRHADQRQ